ncbi:MAG TPA: EAL domain-containing protein, partial [Gemmatimonadaceae bacterium]|nr:EAL domain-containing protein [Gemmatimonadaceae bacterium]
MPRLLSPPEPSVPPAPWLTRLRHTLRGIQVTPRSVPVTPPPRNISDRLPQGWGSALVIGVACIIFLTQSRTPTTLSAAAFVAVATVLLVLVRRVASVRADVATLATSEARFRALVQNSSDVILILDQDSTIRYASPSAHHVLGIDVHELVGRKLIDQAHPDDAVVAQRFFGSLRDGESGPPVVEEWRLARPDGTSLWTENTGTNLMSEPMVAGIVVNARDISERRTLQARLTHQAFHDELTRLANRALFLNRVAHAVVRAPRSRHPAAVLFLDLDDFKKVNDSLGHAIGDELLVATAARLTTCVRPGDTIARLGGDEFAVLLEDVIDMNDIVTVAERISTALRAPFRASRRDVVIGVSIGIATVGPDDTPDDVLRNADLAMYFAKGQSKGQYAIYAREMHAHVMDRLEMEADLRAAVGRCDFHVEYQPIVNLATGDLYGAEALVRWHHPTRGVIPPARFVSLAEETGLIIPIGRAVLREACERARDWRARFRGRRPMQMSVNLSGRHFQEASLLDDVRDALRDSGLEPWALTLEITESVLMQSSDITLERLRSLKALGINLAIDDFGTGYSSLGYLQQFPIDVLKIDRTFVEAVGNEDEDPVLARAIIALGRTLRIETVAEGIERGAQRDGLRELGCMLGQGFLFARPMNATDFASTVLERLPEALSADVATAPPSPGL